MKFTKEEILEQLRNELTKGGKTLHLSDRTINENVDDLLPLLANDETELSDFMSKALPFIRRTNANFEKEKADFIKTYKPVEKDRPVENPNTPPVGDDTISELKAKLEKLESMYETEKRNKTIGALKRSLKSKLKEKGVSDEEWLDTFIPELNITETFDVESKIDSYVKIFNKSKANTPPDVTPLSPVGGTSDKKVNWDDVKNAKI